MQLDDVIAATSPDAARMEEAMKRSVRWLDRCIAAHKYPKTQNLFCIIQGGLDLSLRKRVLACTALLPEQKPRYVMGVGYPEDLIVSVALGADMFDCVWPTRTARFGNAITSSGTLNLRHASYSEDFSVIDPECGLTIHNVHYLLHLMRSARLAIMEDRYPVFIKDFFAKIYGDDPGRFPGWAVTALRTVNVDLLSM
ncbi:MAG: hypothetical protein M1826_003266 [Phylliscum demangeonii]|nr:MAG: hypothetical protein M1826_003266 [Phylliscum demangeonii]